MLLVVSLWFSYNAKVSELVEEIVNAEWIFDVPGSVSWVRDHQFEPSSRVLRQGAFIATNRSRRCYDSQTAFAEN